MMTTFKCETLYHLSKTQYLCTQRIQVYVTVLILSSDTSTTHPAFNFAGLVPFSYEIGLIHFHLVPFINLLITLFFHLLYFMLGGLIETHSHWSLLYSHRPSPRWNVNNSLGGLNLAYSTRSDSYTHVDIQSSYVMSVITKNWPQTSNHKQLIKMQLHTT